MGGGGKDAMAAVFLFAEMQLCADCGLAMECGGVGGPMCRLAWLYLNGKDSTV